MMRWDRVLDRLRDRGFSPREEDFLENYGLYAIDERRIPSDRHFRCTRGYAAFDGAQVEILAFPSEAEALEFLTLVEDEGGWIANHTALVRATGTDLSLLDQIRRSVQDLLAPR